MRSVSRSVWYGFDNLTPPAALPFPGSISMMGLRSFAGRMLVTWLLGYSLPLGAQEPEASPSETRHPSAVDPPVSFRIGPGGIEVVEGSGASLTVVVTVEVPGGATELAHAGDRLYVAGAASGVRTFDVSVPREPRELAPLWPGLRVLSLALSGSRLLVRLADGRIMVHDAGTGAPIAVIDSKLRPAGRPPAEPPPTAKAGRFMLSVRLGYATVPRNVIDPFTLTRAPLEDIESGGMAGVLFGVAFTRSRNSYVLVAADLLWSASPGVSPRIVVGFQQDIPMPVRGLFLCPRLSIGYARASTYVSYGDYGGSVPGNFAVVVPELGIKYVMAGRLFLGLEPFSLPILFDRVPTETMIGYGFSGSLGLQL